jgi:hypothetical protein
VNQIGDAGGFSLAKALANNKNLKDFSLSGVFFFLS